MGQNTLEVYDVIFLTLCACEGGGGRDVLQKLGYLWSIHISQIDDVAFKPYYYGPYSERLSKALDRMIAFGFIDETKCGVPKYEKYLYKLTEDGKKEAKVVASEHKKEFGGIRRIINTCNENNSLKPTDLSNAAKVHYIQYNLPGAKAEKSRATVHTAKELGWKMTARGIEQGNRLLEKLSPARCIA